MSQFCVCIVAYGNSDRIEGSVAECLAMILEMTDITEAQAIRTFALAMLASGPQHVPSAHEVCIERID